MHLKRFVYIFIVYCNVNFTFQKQKTPEKSRLFKTFKRKLNVAYQKKENMETIVSETSQHQNKKLKSARQVYGQVVIGPPGKTLFVPSFFIILYSFYIFRLW